MDGSTTHTLLSKLRQKYSPFLIARVILKLGCEVPERITDPEQDRQLEAKLRAACGELGVECPP